MRKKRVLSEETKRFKGKVMNKLFILSLIFISISISLVSAEVFGYGKTEVIPDTSTTYYPNTFLTLIGTNTSNNVTFIKYYDDVYINISETTGSPSLDVRINFTEVSSFNNILMRLKYDEQATMHDLFLQIYNYDTDSWDTHSDISDQSTLVEINQFISDSVDHIQNGLVQLKFYHPDNGNTNDKLIIDYVQLLKGTTSITINEHDSMSGRNNNCTNHPWVCLLTDALGIRINDINSSLSDYVPYTGATQNVELGEKTLQVANIGAGTFSPDSNFALESDLPIRLRSTTGQSPSFRLEDDDGEYVTWVKSDTGGSTFVTNSQSGQGYNYQLKQLGASGLSNNSFTSSTQYMESTVNNDLYAVHEDRYYLDDATSGHEEGSKRSYIGGLDGASYEEYFRVSSGNQIGFTGDVGIGTTSPSYPLEVNKNVSDISIWTQANISATGFITRTSIFDKALKAKDFIKDSDYFKNQDGTIDHSKFYGYSGFYNITDYSRQEITFIEEEICNESFDAEDKEIKNCTNVSTQEINYPYTIQEEGVNLGMEIDVLRQRLSEYETCLVASKDFTEYKECLK